jgi:S-disulfanyl-L-cysteine oxidoreductase SoxD
MTRPPLLPVAAALLVLAPALAVAAEGRNAWSGVYTQAQATRGAAAYAQHCASCHGDQLAGGDQAPPLAGAAFLANWNGHDAGELFTRIKTTMPLDNPGSLGSATVADIEAMILSANEMPAGTAELPADPAAMNGIAITQEKPAS